MQRIACARALLVRETEMTRWKAALRIILVLAGFLGAAIGEPDKSAIKARDAGAVRFTVGFVLAEGEKLTEGKKLEVVKTLSDRISDPEGGTRDLRIESEGKDRLLVTILAKPAEFSDANLRAWARAITGNGKVSFHMAHPDYRKADLDPEKLPAESIRLPMRKGGDADEDEAPRTMLIHETPEIEGDQIHRMSVTNGFGNWTINLRLKKAGADSFWELSKTHNTQGGTGLPLAIVIDGEIVSAPVFNEPIAGGEAQISGSFTRAEADAIAFRFQRPLPVPLRILSREFLAP